MEKINLFAFGDGHNVPINRIIDIRKNDTFWKQPYIILELDNGRKFYETFKDEFYPAGVNRDLRFNNYLRILT